MSSSSLLDPTAVCHLLDLTDLQDPAPTTSHQVLMVLQVLHFQPTGTQVCPCLDQWVEILDPDPPTDMCSTPGQALDMLLILGVHHRHTSVPLHLITLDRCLCHLVRSAIQFVLSLSRAGKFECCDRMYCVWTPKCIELPGFRIIMSSRK